jgi:hypothetical protein
VSSEQFDNLVVANFEFRISVVRFESSNFDIRLSEFCLCMASGHAVLSRVIVLPGDFRSGAWTGKTAK